MAENTNCPVCGVRLKAKGWRHSTIRFCSPECKDTFHNNRRKAERRRDKALRAIQDMQDMADLPGVDLDALTGSLSDALQNFNAT